MGLQSTQATKEKLVDQILENSVYTTESEMKLRLRNKLLSLSKDDLGCLKLIVDIKVADAAPEENDEAVSYKDTVTEE